MARLFLPLPVILMLSQIASASVLALHEGAIDPESEGWTKQRSFSNVATGPVTNDLGSGFDAWKVDDNGLADGFYQFDLTPEQRDLAFDAGWKLSMRIRVVDFVEVHSSDSASRVNFASFDVKFGALSDGTPQVGFAGVTDVITLNGLDSGYHLYELVYDPSEGNADLFVDGALAFADYDRTSSSLPPRVFFGSTASNGTGHVNYSLVQLEAIPEPSSIFTFAGLALCCGAAGWWERRQRQAA